MSTALIPYKPGDVDARLELVTNICHHIADGDTVAEACERFGITRKTLHVWTHEDEALGNLYAHARSLSAYAYDDEALDVARKSKSETTQADRLRVDTLKWAAAKRRPREYGESSQVTVISADVQNRIKATVTLIQSQPEWKSADLLAQLDSVWR